MELKLSYELDMLLNSGSTYVACSLAAVAAAVLRTSAQDNLNGTVLAQLLVLY